MHFFLFAEVHIEGVDQDYCADSKKHCNKKQYDEQEDVYPRLQRHTFLAISAACRKLAEAYAIRALSAVLALRVADKLLVGLKIRVSGYIREHHFSIRVSLYSYRDLKEVPVNHGD